MQLKLETASYVIGFEVLKVYLNSCTVLRLLIVYFKHRVPEKQKQPSRGVHRKRCSENIQQIYGRVPVPECDFNKVAATVLKPHFGMGALE